MAKRTGVKRTGQESMDHLADVLKHLAKRLRTPAYKVQTEVTRDELAETLLLIAEQIES